MINPATYEGLAYSLTTAADQVTYDVAEALTGVHKQIIKDPMNINKAHAAYQKIINSSLVEWNKQWRGWVDGDLATAYLRGISDAEFEIAAMNRAAGTTRGAFGEVPKDTILSGNVPPIEVPPVPGSVQAAFSKYTQHLTAVNVYRGVAYNTLQNTTLQIMRTADDMFRKIAVQSMDKLYTETEIFTRRKLSQDMLNQFAKAGLQSVTYANGAKVSLTAYSEMVGRTMTGHAAVEASLNRYAEYGYDLIRVSAHFMACEMCGQWEMRILSRSGQSKMYPPLQDAIALGLFHPNCLHDISPYHPGISQKQIEVRVDPAAQKLIDQHGYSEAQKIAYKAQQKQRYLERAIRQSKMKEITALSPQEQIAAHQNVLKYRSAIRQHVTDNPFLPRKPERELVSGWRTAAKKTAELKKASITKTTTTLKTPVVKGPASVADVRNINELEIHLKTNWNLKSVNLQGLDLQMMKANFSNLETLNKLNPNLKIIDNLITIEQGKAGIMAVSNIVEGSKITGLSLEINPYYYKSGNFNSLSTRLSQRVKERLFAKGTDPNNVIIHEIGHFVDFQQTALQTSNTVGHFYMAGWGSKNGTSYAQELVRQAQNSTKILDRRLISTYAHSSYSETLSESLVDVFVNGGKANPLSQKIVELMGVALP